MDCWKMFDGFVSNFKFRELLSLMGKNDGSPRSPPWFGRPEEHWEVQELPDQDASEDDVVLLVKQFMNHTHLSQQPLVILSRSTLDHMPLTGPTGVLPRNPLTEKLVKEYEKTAKLVEQEPWNLHKAAEYLRTWTSDNQNNSEKEPPKFQFDMISHSVLKSALTPEHQLLQEFAPDPPKAVTVELGPPPVPKANKAKPKAAPAPKPKEKAKAKAKPAGKAASKAKAKVNGKAKSKAEAKAKAAARPEAPEDDAPFELIKYVFSCQFFLSYDLEGNVGDIKLDPQWAPRIRILPGLLLIEAASANLKQSWGAPSAGGHHARNAVHDTMSTCNMVGQQVDSWSKGNRESCSANRTIDRMVFMLVFSKCGSGGVNETYYLMILNIFL